MEGRSDGTTRVWLAERTYSDDELNIVILEYATPGGDRYLRRERALTSFSDELAVPVSLEVEPAGLGTVPDDLRAEYARAVRDVRSRHGPDDTV